MGLVNRVVGQGEALTAAREMAAEIAANGPLAVRHAKAAANRSQDVDLVSGLEYEADQFALLFASEDAREGMGAFVERRRPGFQGSGSHIVRETKLRVRYAEIDAQGHVNNANYLSYFEVGRVEWLRDAGLSYREMEARGFGFVVVEALVHYHRAAYFDDELMLRTRLAEAGRVSLRFEYELLRDGASDRHGPHPPRLRAPPAAGRLPEDPHARRVS